MSLKKILESSRDTNQRLFIVFYCDGDHDLNKIKNNTKNICLQTANGPVFQVIGVFGDDTFINFIHTLTNNTQLISSIDSEYLQLNKNIISAKVYYEYKTFYEIFTYDYTNKNICDIIEKFEDVIFKQSYSYNVYDNCNHKICDKCYLDDNHYCNCNPELSTYNYFNCKCIEHLDKKFSDARTNLSLANYRIFCISEENVKILLNDKHPEHKELSKKINLSIGLYYS